MPNQAKNLVGRQLPHWLRMPAVKARHFVDYSLLNYHVAKAGFDIYHETGAIPLLANKTVPTVLTIYDLSLVTHPQFHPADSQEIQDAISNIAENSALRKRLITAGNNRAKDFSWTYATNKTLDLFSRIKN